MYKITFKHRATVDKLKNVKPYKINMFYMYLYHFYVQVFNVYFLHPLVTVHREWSDWLID